MDQAAADGIVQKTGVLSMTYYPLVHADDLEYKISDDVDWILEDVTLGDDDRQALRELISRTIIDPTGFREELIESVFALVTAPTV